MREMAPATTPPGIPIGLHDHFAPCRSLWGDGEKNDISSQEGETDILKTIQVLRENPNIKFFYLTHALPKRSTKYHYYNLKVSSFDKLNRSNYFTLSLHGCTHLVTNDEIEHISLERFESEYKTFTNICKIPTFARFRLWKGFIRWRKVIRYTKIDQCRRHLRDNLYIANSSLRPALLNVREMCYRISDMGLCKLEKGKTYTLLEFLTNQVNQLNEVCTRLCEFRELVKEVVRSACRTALLESGFMPDDYFVNSNAVPMNMERNLYDIEELVEGCKLSAKRLRLETVPYDIDHPLVGQAMKVVTLGLRQIKNNRAKLERRTEKMKNQTQNPNSSYLSTGYDVEVYSELPDKMTFTEMAAKRKHCQRLTCFIRLADYQIVSTLHTLTVNSVYTLLDCLCDHLRHTPPVSEISSYQIRVEELTEAPDATHGMKRPDDYRASRTASVVKTDSPAEAAALLVTEVQPPPIPLFVLEFILEPSKLYMIPDELLFRDGILEIINKFQEQVFNIKNLVPDPYFDAFTRPIINNKFEDKTCGIGPQLQHMFAEDTGLREIIENVKISLSRAFEAVTAYMNTFMEIHSFYHENDSITTDLLQTAQKNVKFYRDGLLTHHRQVMMTLMVPLQRPIGMFLIDTSTMRSLLLPSPNNCLELFHALLPVDARTEVDRLVLETQEADYTLSLVPSSTADFVEHLQFMVHIQGRIDPIEKEADTVKELYDMIEAFGVPVPPEDFAVYQSLLPSIDRAKNSIDKALADKDSVVDLFFASLDKDIAELLHDMKDAKQAINNPLLLDATAERETVRTELQKMKDTIEDLQTRSTLYREYHKSFKELIQTLSGTPLEVEQPRFEELELLVSEMRLKQLLWSSLDDWDEVHQEWMTADFLKLKTDDLSGTTQKFIKSLNMLEKGLPPNNVIPLLKERVDGMREMLPAIMDMRNPNLQPRHWQKLEQLIGLNLEEMETPLTLGLLVELDAFKHIEAIQEVSSQASSEASLEQLLKKVEDAWKSTEFTVLPFKDSKDIFIVGGTDEIQQLYDDSMINISTIASSRHVGPIKGRVEEWTVLLELFGKTLEEWLMCQRSWLYLESIFSAPDIQRQLPSEAKSFMAVDKSYKDVMRKVQKVPLAMRAATQPGLLDTFRNNNQLLEQIQKCLEAYLESKRAVFPRFYFLSNDELLEILAQTRNPLAVQPHLRKCFDAIQKLDFGLAPDSRKEEPVYTNDILAMVSPEGEHVGLGKGLKARGNVEDWLGKVEEAMFGNLRRLMKIAINSFESSDREDWLQAHANQIILTVEQLMWSRDLTCVLEAPLPEDRLTGLEEYEKKCFSELNKLATLVRGELPKLYRALLCALITIDVHSRDMVTELVHNKVDSLNNFDWQRQLRYYWDTDVDTCLVRMANACYVYGYEYLGASPRLVITPLTDRCYLCLMGALELDLGGAPAGPAGTGKTETTKDLAKSVAKQCVVFNCSDGLDYKMMGRFFSGLAQSGAWCCFDEFNRIDIEVLSVIAQQLITIRNAKIAKVSRFMFESREIKLVATCAAFITMNPGYAGRTELPDNLKALFRPISMMVPDYRLIAEVILYSEGFESSNKLALKMTQMYKLCSEQLSQQDHYDFGMRALKSVLVMAGALKRQNPDKPEDVVLIRALRDSNLPKFLKQDAILFSAILQDLFPGVTLPEHDYGRFLAEIETVLTNMGLQIVSEQVTKVIQFYETLLVRHGVMLVGPTGGGKTTVYRVLIQVLTNLHNAGFSEEVPEYQPVKTYVLNPKAITMGELYGEVNKLTLEWHDGLMPSIVRKTCVDLTEDHQWVICDGPVDALWIENMNTVLDDNKMLCLANSERIKLTNYVHMLFEVQDLAVASPATVSRCGMVFVDSEDLGWMPYVQTWINSISSKLNAQVIEYLLMLFSGYVDNCLDYVMNQCITIVPQVPIARVQTMCKLLEVLLTHPGGPSMDLEKNKMNPLLAMTFIFSMIWGLGGPSIEGNWDAIDTFVRGLFDDLGDARLPQHNDLWSCYVDMDTRHMDSWEKMLGTFTYKKEIPFFDMVVPTMDTVRYGYLLDKLLAARQSVLFTGLTGVGKTSSGRTQEMIEAKLEKRKKGVRGAPKDKRVILFVDDLNMPKQDTYGSQPPIELLRQFQDFGGFYDRDKLEWMEIVDMTLSAACGPPGGGRCQVSPRLIRHFTVLAIPPPTETSLKQIFLSILKGFLRDFSQSVRGVAESIIQAAVEVYVRMAMELLPTPEKSHYVFNLRDLSKCVQGILQCDSSVIRDKTSITRLFFHESQRVFHDRLINQADKTFFNEMLVEMSGKYFGEKLEIETFIKTPILFGDFAKPGLPRAERLYEEFMSLEKLQSILDDYLDDYNMTLSKDTKLVFFLDAMEHVCRIARMIRQDRGNALLVGVGGTGKQSLTRLAAHINDYRCFQIELCRGYDYNSFHDDLKKLYFSSGMENTPTVFLFTDNQIVVEEFLEDINNILNSGEVPNLLENDEYERLIIGCRAAAKEAGIPEGNRDGIFEFCINRVRSNLHVVLCMSPVGSDFRVRCRMFPSLVNCCTIDWFVEWPEDALYSVALSTFEPIELGPPEMKANIAQLSTEIHLSVSQASDRFYLELKRHFYTTPTSYLELLGLYLTMLKTKTKELSDLRNKFKNGLNKILETNDLVVNMEVELTAMRPTLEVKQRDTEVLMHKLGEDQEQADIVRTRVKEDEGVAKIKATETQAIADDAQRDLDEALPALEAANKALDSLDKSDISELRVFTKPPQLVQTVMEAVCLMLGQKPDWSAAKILLSDSNFLRRLFEYPKDEITELQLKKLKKYIDNPDFTPEVVEKTSKACKSMCMWVRALDLYARVFRTVEPKKKRLEAANAELDVVISKLREKQAELTAVERKIAILQSEFDVSVADKKKLEHRLALTTARLKRAAKLTAALSGEQGRWGILVEQYQVQIGNVIGDVFVAAACMAYYGAFTADYRENLFSKWVERCRELEIPVSEGTSLFNVLGTAFELREWNTQGLPRDQVSTDNAILVTRTRRWPLMIDPQEQANRWIRNMEAENNLKVAKLTDNNLLRIMENCIRLGFPMLIEDLGETLDPALEPILLRHTFVVQGRLLIRLGDSDVDYDKNFHLYMTTKMANPHYLPEVCIKVTLINFTVTPAGLEDQLLGDVTGIERPELEEQRSQLIVRINTDRNQLKDTEDRILKLLFETEGNILDNEDLINTLNESKVKSAEISRRLSEATTTEQKITNARSKYSPVAARGSVMYFVITTMAEIDPMYQFSLKYFKNLFNSTIQDSPASEILEERIQILLTRTTLDTYNSVARGLFERDKVVFSFMLCGQIMRQLEKISTEEWIYFLLGSSLVPTNKNPQPDETKSWLTIRQWRRLVELANKFPEKFGKLPEDLVNGLICLRFAPERDENEGARRPSINSNNDDSYAITPKDANRQPTEYNNVLTSFQKLMLIASFAEEEVVRAVTDFVRTNLGEEFIEAPACSLPLLYKEMDRITPLVFILSAGSDPMNQFQKFAKEQNYMERIHAVSLGQGQGPNAEKLMEQAAKDGDWVFLQNCHLAASWMIRLEELVKLRADDQRGTHKEYRLYLSSMPAKAFPISVLQNSVKVTNEPPKGLRANLGRALNDISVEFFETHRLGEMWRTLVFGICFFHAIVLERKKFGPLGWNISYDFNDSDRECALSNLGIFCSDNEVPWDALTYVTSEITYGGRVTDCWDQRCLRTILQRFFHSNTLEPSYTYSESGIYYPPDQIKLQDYKDYVSNLPFNAPPELFGLHENANLAYQIQETNSLIMTVLSVQPRSSAAGGAKTNDEVAFELADSILERLPDCLDLKVAKPEYFEKDSKGRVDSLTTVMTQEVDRFNKLLSTVKESLRQLKKAIKGFVVMSEALEQIYMAFLHNQIPNMWSAAAYPSLKPLSSWVTDLVLRCDFINSWMIRGRPRSFWLSGFFFPQGFLTGILQNYARKHNFPIDHLSFDFTVLPYYRDQEAISKATAKLMLTETLEEDKQIPEPRDGVLFHGLFMDGFRWDDKRMELTDSVLGEMLAVMPIMHMKPEIDHKPDPNKYISPVYKTSIRAGILSTTGHSTNFIVEIYLPQSNKVDYWIEKGAALLSMRDD